MQENVTYMHHNKLAYSIREMSELIGICERKIHYEIKQGKIKVSRIGTRILVRASEIDRWLSEAEESN